MLRRINSVAEAIEIAEALKVFVRDTEVETVVAEYSENRDEAFQAVGNLHDVLDDAKSDAEALRDEVETFEPEEEEVEEEEETEEEA